MIKLSELQDATVVAGLVDAAIGPAVPTNHRRYVFAIRAANAFAGANTLIVGTRENGAGVTTQRWATPGLLIGDIDVDPDGPLTEDSLPLFSLGGPGVGGASTVRVVTSAGNYAVAIRYADLLETS